MAFVHHSQHSMALFVAKIGWRYVSRFRSLISSDSTLSDRSIGPAIQWYNTQQPLLQRKQQQIVSHALMDRRGHSVVSLVVWSIGRSKIPTKLLTFYFIEWLGGECFFWPPR